MKYRKKPVVIEAIQLTGEDSNIKNVLEFIGQTIDLRHSVSKDKFTEYCDIVRSDNGLTIKTLEGRMKASIGDYIIKGVSNEFYPCKPDIFALTYENV